MRFLELFEQLLLEHNVVNTKDIADYVEQFASTCRNEFAADWFRHTLARHLERDDQVNVKLNDTNVPRNAPAWLDSAVARGDDLRVFQPPFHMNTDFEHLADYFNFLDERSDPVIQNRDRLLKVTVDAAVKRANEWTAAAAKSAMKTEVKDVEETFRDGTFRWIEPKSFEAYTRDGAILGHCTAQGTYDKEFRSGAMKFYFLHDAKGQPHVCLSMTKGGALDQVKGKQNQPPVGRYIQLCANFLNHLHLADAAENYDVKRMGLKVNGEGKLSTASAMGVLVHKIGSVRIYKIEAAAFTIQQRGGYGAENKKVAGGDDYWFNSSDGDLFRINISAEGGGRAYVNGFACEAEQARNLTQQFLNSDYFPNGAPQPLETNANGASSNDITHQFHLSYDYLSKRYGTVQEVSEKKLEVEGGYTGYVRGKSQYGRVKPELVVFGPESEIEPVLQVELGDSIGGPQYGATADRDLLIKLYNRIDLPPSDEYRQSRWRKAVHIYYDMENRKYGGIEVCRKLWSKGGYSLHHRKENDSKESFMMVKDGEQDAVYEFTKGESEQLSFIHGDSYGDAPEAGTKTALITKTMLGVLNQCNDLQWLRESKAGRLDAFNIFFGNGKWQSRESAGEMMHKFDDGAYITSIPRMGSQVTYSFYDASDALICAVTLDNEARAGSSLIDHHVFSDQKIRASRYMLWLLNQVKLPMVDLVDGDTGYNAKDTPRQFLWQMGLFHDTRSDEWKLVQDGKLVYDGDGYRAVNFRNRIFVIDNADGCVGWFKKGDSSTPAHIVTDPHVFPPATFSDFYGYMADLCRNTDFEMPKVTTQHRHEDGRRKHGYAHNPENGEFDAIEKFHPTETVLDLPKGYKWIRKASDPTFYDGEKEEKLHPDRFSLADKDGKTFMRVETDGDYVVKVTFSGKDTFESYNLTNDLAEMKDGPQKKFFLQLLEKLQVKLTPTQAAAIKYYRTKTGAYKPLEGHPMLEAYMKGSIDFGDGHIFKRDRHYDSDTKQHLTKWELGIEDETEEYSYNKWKPYIRVILDDDGIDSVKYLKKDVKRQPSQYMPYIQKLMKIFTTLAGE